MTENQLQSFYYNRDMAALSDYRTYMEERTRAEEKIGDKITSTIDIMRSDIQNTVNNQTLALVASQAVLNKTLSQGFSQVSNQLGEMGVGMQIGFARTETAISRLSNEICERLDAINDTLENPLQTQARVLYKRASTNYKKGFYEKALEDVKQALEKNKTDYISQFLMGEIYLFGVGEFCNVINLDDAISALQNAAKYIKPFAEANDIEQGFRFLINTGYVSYTKEVDIGSGRSKTDKSNAEYQNLEKAAAELQRLGVRVDRFEYEELLTIIGFSTQCFKVNVTYQFPDKLFTKKETDAIEKVFKSFNIEYSIGDERVTIHARNLAAEIWFYLGLAYYSKANEMFVKGNTSENEKLLKNAEVSFGNAYAFSEKMLESLYNRARCRALTGNSAGAITDLETLVSREKNYCVKVCFDNDFSSIEKEFTAFIKTLRENLLQSAKRDYDSINAMHTNIVLLGGRTKARIPPNFSDKLSYFESLDFNKDLKGILTIVQSDLAKVEQKERVLSAKKEVTLAELKTSQDKQASINTFHKVDQYGAFFSLVEKYSELLPTLKSFPERYALQEQIDECAKRLKECQEKQKEFTKIKFIRGLDNSYQDKEYCTIRINDKDVGSIKGGEDCEIILPKHEQYNISFKCQESLKLKIFEPINLTLSSDMKVIHLVVKQGFFSSGKILAKEQMPK
ncbi:MAG: hypothetical protein LBM77_01015 [Spirochaetaceae bacterium]|jgi:tetratricopeptide (TPR) repeat protein|nr:hypothetical protein [Spirochaetaceae bacterium]